MNNPLDHTIAQQAFRIQELQHELNTAVEELRWAYRRLNQLEPRPSDYLVADNYMIQVSASDKSELLDKELEPILKKKAG